MTIALTILVFAVLLGAVGQIMLKTGLMELGTSPPPLTVLRSIFTQWQVFMGFACYGISSLLYLIALSRLPVSYAYPMVALSYVVVTFFSWKLLGEIVPPQRVAGLGLICVGVLIVALSYTKPQPASAAPPPALQIDAGSTR